MYDRTAGFGQDSSLITIDSRGGDRRPIAGTSGGHPIAWTPTGIVFVRQTPPSSAEIMLVSPSGGTPVTLYTSARLIGRFALISS